MDNTIYEYIKRGIIINGNPLDGYRVFTIPTKWFDMDSLHQLTPETFEREIQKQKQHDELTSEIFKEVQKEIDQEILNQLRGGEPNPDIIPMNTYESTSKRKIQ
jgi:TPP-dependent pyruvate/acetoin dehydrogenase alpha subunit